jgi:hypothetical protein
MLRILLVRGRVLLDRLVAAVGQKLSFVFRNSLQ